MKLDSASFAIFDVETTGLYPYSGDKICEIAAIKIEPHEGRRSKSPKRFHHLVDPGRAISPAAFQVNGITPDMVRGKPTPGEILPRFMDFIEGSILVAYNAGFDLGFLECGLGDRKAELNNYYIIDALRLARRLFPGVGRYNLGYLSEALGIRSFGEHRAMADAYMTWRVFEKEMFILSNEGINMIEDIAQIGSRRQVPLNKVSHYKVKMIERAIREQKSLNIIYRSAWTDKLTERVITPKAMEKGYDRTYVVAHCHLRGAERNFRLDRIVEVKSAA